MPQDKNEQQAKLVGVVTHFFPKIGVAAIQLKGSLKVGDKVKIVGTKTECEEVVASLESEHQPLKEAKAPMEVGMKVKNKVREGDRVYLI